MSTSTPTFPLIEESDIEQEHIFASAYSPPGPKTEDLEAANAALLKAAATEATPSGPFQLTRSSITGSGTPLSIPNTGASSKDPADGPSFFGAKSPQ